MRRTLAALALPLALLAACGGDDDGDRDAAADPAAGSPSASEDPAEDPSASPGVSPSPPGSADWPECAEVWQADATLPGGYRGCLEDGTPVKAQSRFCEFGRPLVTYADQWWAVPTGTVHRVDGALRQDREYRSAMASCAG